MGLPMEKLADLGDNRGGEAPPPPLLDDNMTSLLLFGLDGGDVEDEAARWFWKALRPLSPL